jgi:hypothetical protein
MPRFDTSSLADRGSFILRDVQGAWQSNEEAMVGGEVGPEAVSGANRKAPGGITE